LETCGRISLQERLWFKSTAMTISIKSAGS
jgi:hypothetical protein